MIQFSSTKDTSTSYQGLAALETMPGPIGIKAQESPVEGGSGSKILEANFGATVVAETGLCLIGTRPFLSTVAARLVRRSCVCVLLKNRDGCVRLLVDHNTTGIPLIRVSGLYPLFWFACSFT